MFDLCDGGQNLSPLVGDRVKVSENLGATTGRPCGYIPVVTKYLVKTHVITSEIISQKEYRPNAVEVKN